MAEEKCTRALFNVKHFDKKTQLNYQKPYLRGRKEKQEKECLSRQSIIDFNVLPLNLILDLNQYSKEGHHP